MSSEAALAEPRVHVARTPRKRQAIIEAARRIFAEKGYSASMEEVAFEADVSKQTIYNQFGSKDQLFHAMIEDRLAELSAPFMRASPDADPRAVLMELGRIYHTRIIAPENVKMTRMLLAAPNAAAVMRDFYNHGPTLFGRVFTDWLSQQHKSGRLNVPDPALAAEHFLSFTYGGLYMKRLFGVDAPLDMADIERRLKYCVDAFLKAHASR